MTPQQFVSQLCNLRFADAFNPYFDRCSVHDLEDASQRRSGSLEHMLAKAVSADIDAIWIGRDLGFRGGRRTGMALTDDVHFQTHLSRWGISRAKPTIGQPVPERTATCIWEMLEEIDVPIFLWNVFPLHPHEPEASFTNRAPSVGKIAKSDLRYTSTGSPGAIIVVRPRLSRSTGQCSKAHLLRRSAR
ncbi:uracil-DNA glycosylase [Sphingomonas gei]|uniref:Uracil-DNA glycosylase n=1 Tax=Sphingomonas gei TaxID=1395960 RepID=A0A4S1XH05_9SPHN|nr:uracil-DNA glycosylase [Sphingomonas gei]TGX55013.1 uracil-DNA glycosylase [Sphingomonas gei]